MRQVFDVQVLGACESHLPRVFDGRVGQESELHCWRGHEPRELECTSVYQSLRCAYVEAGVRIRLGCRFDAVRLGLECAATATKVFRDVQWDLGGRKIRGTKCHGLDRGKAVGQLPYKRPTPRKITRCRSFRRLRCCCYSHRWSNKDATRTRIRQRGRRPDFGAVAQVHGAFAIASTIINAKARSTFRDACLFRLRVRVVPVCELSLVAVFLRNFSFVKVPWPRVCSKGGMWGWGCGGRWCVCRSSAPKKYCNTGIHRQERESGTLAHTQELKKGNKNKDRNGCK